MPRTVKIPKAIAVAKGDKHIFVVYPMMPDDITNIISVQLLRKCGLRVYGSLDDIPFKRWNRDLCYFLNLPSNSSFVEVHSAVKDMPHKTVELTEGNEKLRLIAISEDSSEKALEYFDEYIVPSIKKHLWGQSYVVRSSYVVSGYKNGSWTYVFGLSPFDPQLYKAYFNQDIDPEDIKDPDLKPLFVVWRQSDT